MHAFRAPETSLGDLDAEATASLIAAAADIALVVDGAGAIRDCAVSSEDLSRDLGGGDWFGRPWLDTVTEESRPKVEALIRDAAARAAPPGASVPILLSAVRLGKADRAVAFGRDLRAVSALQQRLIDAQRSVERDHARPRQAETRYRLLFQMSPEPVLVLDATAFKVQEVNPAAARLFGKEARRAIGRPFAEASDAQSQSAVESLLSGARAAGRADDVRAPLVGGAARSGGVRLLVPPGRRLVRARPLVVGLRGAPGRAHRLGQDEGQAPRARGGRAGRLRRHRAGRARAVGQLHVPRNGAGRRGGAGGGRVAGALVRPAGVELDVLMGNLRQRGAVRLFAATLRGGYGAATGVEISAIKVMNGGQPCFGFAIRDVGMRLPRPARGDAHAGSGRAPLRSVEQITDLIGRVPLKDLLPEATDVIERLCIEAAHDLTSDNRASRAEMLGLSRQSLYVKLRRCGLGDLGAEDGGNGAAG